MHSAPKENLEEAVLLLQVLHSQSVSLDLISSKKQAAICPSQHAHDDDTTKKHYGMVEILTALGSAVDKFVNGGFL